MNTPQYSTPSNETRVQGTGINANNAAIYDRLQTHIERLESKSNLLTRVLTGTAIALVGLLGWSIFQSIEQAKLSERQTAIMAVTSDSVDLERLQSVNNDLKELEQRLPEGAASLLEQNRAEIANLKTQLSQVQATAQSAEAQADSQTASSADVKTVASLSAQIQELNQSIGSLQSKVDAQATQLTQLQSAPAAVPVTQPSATEPAPASN